MHLEKSSAKFGHFVSSSMGCCTEAVDGTVDSRYNLIAHYGDVIMGAIVYQITSLTIVYSTVYPDADQRKHQSSASLAFVWGNHRGPVNSPHKWLVTRKMFPFDDVIMPGQCTGRDRLSTLIYLAVVDQG